MLASTPSDLNIIVICLPHGFVNYVSYNPPMQVTNFVDEIMLSC